MDSSQIERMSIIMKKAIIFLLVIFLLTTPAYAADTVPTILTYSDTDDVDASIFEETVIPATAAELEISSPCAILIEKETGTVLYEKNADEKYEPASVTKVMTILLILEAVESSALSLDDMVETSAYAASMGGSQIFLEEGERMNVRDIDRKSTRLNSSH